MKIGEIGTIKSGIFKGVQAKILLMPNNTVKAEIMDNEKLTEPKTKTVIPAGSLRGVRVELKVENFIGANPNNPPVDLVKEIEKLDTSALRIMIIKYSNLRRSNKINQTVIADFMGTKNSNISDIETLKNYTPARVARYVFAISKLVK